MKKELKESLDQLLTLPNADVIKTVRELAKMFSFEVPVWSVGISKRQYLISALLKLEHVTENMNVQEREAKTVELVKVAADQIKTADKPITGYQTFKRNIRLFLNLSFFLNLRNRKN